MSSDCDDNDIALAVAKTFLRRSYVNHEGSRRFVVAAAGSTAQDHSRDRKKSGLA
jgi:hypothetical protein